MRYTSIAFAVLLSFASSPAFSQFDNLLRGMKKLAGELEKGQQAPSAPPQQQQQQPQPQQAQQPQPQPTPVGVASDQENSFVKCANPELTFGGACLGTISKGINAYLTGGTGSSNLGEFGDQFKKLGVLLSQKKMGCQLEPDNVRQVFKEIPDNGLISLALVNCNLRMSSGLVVQEIEIANLPAGPTVYQIGALYGGAPNNSLDESSSFGKALREKYGQPNCRRKNTSQLCFARGTLQMTIGHSDENRDIFEVSFSESRVVVKPSNSPSEESQNANNLQHSDLLANDYARERFKAKAAALPITKF